MKPIELFVNQLSKNWGYAIPSDNIWVVYIKPHNRGNGAAGESSFEKLYSNIISVNNSYKQSFSNTKWLIELNEGTNNFFGGFNTSIGLFLATDVTYATNSNNIQDTTDGNFSSHGGFLSQGKIMLSRNSQLESKITFAATNWDINEIFIDPWISAISQQGLIESSELPNIKADITILQYASSHPGKFLMGDEIVLRKEINLYEAFPKSRDNPKMTYETTEAGILKTYSTTFAFRDYSIKYHAGFGATI